MNSATQSSRAAHVAEVHFAGINASRKRCGLAPLTLAELTHEYADLDRQPVNAKPSRRYAGNAMAARPGAPTTQSEIDAMWTGIVQRLNAAVAGRAEHGLRNSRGQDSPPAAEQRSGSRAPQSQAEIDAMHAEIVDRLNATLPEPWRRPKARRTAD